MSAEHSPGEPGGHGGRKNRLSESSSPYLLLHQYNPVDWYEWGEEALTKAREEGKPIFLSVGYSTCYWCHVMERESFSNPEIAALMNEHFVAIKVDREQRPDLDEIYMAATQILTQRGGWPNSLFLTPELKPFFAGTYFPPEDRYGRPGFSRILSGIADAWVNRREEILQQAEQLSEAMARHLERRLEPSAELPPGDVVTRSVSSLSERYDRAWGGFGGAPKFPTPSNLFLLFDQWEQPAAREMLVGTLDQMARGGLYDQIGGGFHRYSTDREWKVPHFEKMLYDNGLLLEIYAKTFELDGNPEWARVVRETVAFLERELEAPEGALWSAIDAETDGHEGAFYVWTGEELRAVLGEESATELAPILGFDGEPFFEETHYVLHLPASLVDQAGRLGVEREALLRTIDPLRQRLLAARGERKRPLTDDKILADWNGLAIGGLATAGRVLDDEELVGRAARAADFVLSRMRADDGTLLHVWRAGRAEIPAFLADYAYLVHGLLALHRATGSERWLGEARRLATEQTERLGDPAGGWYAAAESSDVLFRSKDIFDGALPAANSVAVHNALDLAAALGEPSWRAEAERALLAFGRLLEAQPAASNTLASAAGRVSPVTARTASVGVADEVPTDGPQGLAHRVVRATLDATAADGDGRSRFTVALQVADGWHVNANPASLDYLIPTSVAADGAAVRNLAYPPAEELRFAFADQVLAVWQGEVAITGEIDGVASARAIRLTYQACDDQRCLPPVSIDLPLD